MWAIRVRLQLHSNLRDLALFNLAIDSKLGPCDLLELRVADIVHDNHVNSRAVAMPRKTRRPVQLEIIKPPLSVATAFEGRRQPRIVERKRGGRTPRRNGLPAGCSDYTDDLASALDPGWLLRILAIALQAAILVRGDSQLASAFCVSRLRERRGLAFRHLGAGSATSFLPERALPIQLHT
jgi:hypothetical protein